MPNTEKLAKVPYTCPQLIVYGGFAQLTAGGSGMSQEASMSLDLMQRP